jgi:hypothetical protein
MSLIPIYVPYVNGRELLVRALDSLEAYRSWAVVVDNSETHDIPAGVAVLRPQVPLFSSQTCRYIQGRRDERFFFLHHDAVTCPEAIERVLQRAAELKREGRSWSVIYTLYDAFCLFNGHLLNLAGVIPDIRMPCYVFDADWYRQMDLAGLARVNVGDCNGRVRHDAPSATKRACRAHAAFVDTTNSERYYELKWGGLPGQEKFTRPWNA